MKLLLFQRRQGSVILVDEKKISRIVICEKARYEANTVTKSSFQTFQKPALSSIEGFNRFAPFKTFREFSKL